MTLGNGRLDFHKLIPYDRNLCNNLPLFYEPIPNFSSVVIDPDNDPLQNHFMKSRGGTKTEQHKAMAARMTEDLNSKYAAKQNLWKYFKMLVLSKDKQREIIQRACDKRTYEKIKQLKFENLPYSIASKSKIMKLVLLAEQAESEDVRKLAVNAL